jgi:ubiquinone/menaquinone biosynthesis C-methylase UbiE
VQDNSPQGHQHAGKSSKAFLNAEQVLKETGLKIGDKFLDIGCGEGYFSVAASKIVGNQGKVYAVDTYEQSILALREQIHRDNINNIEAIIADVTRKIPLTHAIVDVCFMANLLHGFLANKEVGSTMTEVARVMKSGGTLAVVDFKKVEGTPGPPVSIRMAQDEVDALIAGYGFKKKISVEVGLYHYAIIFCYTPLKQLPK